MTKSQFPLAGCPMCRLAIIQCFSCSSKMVSIGQCTQAPHPCMETTVEVRGIEPRSVGTSVAASPSAADGEPSGGRTPSASDRPPYTRIDLDPPVRASRRVHPAKRRPLRRRQEPLRGTGYLSLGSQCKVWLGTYGCYRLFSEDSGDLGSLPTPLLPTSKPVHPHWRLSDQSIPTP